VRVAKSQRAPAGAHATLDVHEDFAFDGGDFRSAHSVIDLTLAHSAGKWTCTNATSRLLSASSRRGPVSDQPGAPEEITVAVQEALDNLAKRPASAPTPRAGKP